MLKPKEATFEQRLGISGYGRWMVTIGKSVDTKLKANVVILMTYGHMYWADFTWRPWGYESRIALYSNL